MSGKDTWNKGLGPGFYTSQHGVAPEKSRQDLKKSAQLWRCWRKLWRSRASSLDVGAAPEKSCRHLQKSAQLWRCRRKLWRSPVGSLDVVAAPEKSRQDLKKSSQLWRCRRKLWRFFSGIPGARRALLRLNYEYSRLSAARARLLPAPRLDERATRCAGERRRRGSSITRIVRGGGTGFRCAEGVAAGDRAAGTAAPARHSHLGTSHPRADCRLRAGRFRAWREPVADPAGRGQRPARADRGSAPLGGRLAHAVAGGRILQRALRADRRSPPGSRPCLDLSPEPRPAGGLQRRRPRLAGGLRRGGGPAVRLLVSPSGPGVRASRATGTRGSRER